MRLLTMPFIASVLLLGVIPAFSDDLEDRLLDLSSTDENLRNAAVQELAGRGHEAVKPLVKLMAGEDHTAAAGARLALQFLAQNAAAPGKVRERSKAALAFLEAVGEDHPLEVRRWVLRQVSFIGGYECVKGLGELIEDPDMGDLAVMSLSRIPGKASLEVMKKALEKKLPPDRKIGLVHAVARKRDPSARESLLALVEDGNREVRCAALEGLGRIPCVESAELLWKTGCTWPDPAGARIRDAFLELADSLLSVGRKEEALHMFRRMFEKGPLERDRCGGLAGIVKIEGEGAVALLLDVIENEPPDLSGAAVELLAGMEGESITLAMAGAAALSAGQTRVHLIRVLGQREDPAAPMADSVIMTALKEAPDSEKVLILEALGERRDEKLLDCFLKATRCESEDVVVAALEALGRLKDRRSAPRMLEIADKGRERERSAALRAYIRIGEGMAAKDRPEAFEIFRTALELAREEEEKKTVMDQMGRLGELEAVSLIRPFLKEESDSLRDAAARALAPLAMKTADEASPERAEPLLREVVRHADHSGLVKDAVDKLRELGYEAEVPVREGYVKDFWVIGPFEGRTELMTRDVFPVEDPVRLFSEIRYKDKVHTWMQRKPEHLHGMLDLLEAVARADDAGAYVYAELKCAKERDATFHIGSDDDVYCWLNGEKIHAFEGGRGWSPDQDAVDVHLKSGVNRVLLKVLNGSGGWAVSLRIVDRQGQALDIESL